MRTPELPAALLRRQAVVYVRQSTGAQVRDNLESQRRQYELVDLARTCGFSQVELIDDDLGRSGSGTVARPGFDRLVAMICAGGVGAVFCLEASRLARNGRDWHHLLELCGLVKARVIDSDGVYDPSHPNDRLLLGMKGTISEFELGVMRARMTEAKWAKAGRGELKISVPVGFVWPQGAGVCFDPDLRIQEVIRTVFRKFQELGSARQVLLWMAAEELSFPRPEDGKSSTSFEWRKIRYRNVISILKNPCYAGAYAYGKSTQSTEIIDGRARKRYGRALPMREWRVLIKDHHEGYITWDEFEQNQAQLARNAFGKAGGAAKSGRGGRALLPGLLRCQRCGHIFGVVYTGKTHAPKYRCGKLREMHGHGWCISFAAFSADRAIAQELLHAVQPLAVEAAMEAEREVTEQHDEAVRLRELELTRAQYEARVAERRYASCDPENRLVAAQLEARWEESMRRVADIEQRLRQSPVPNAALVQRNLEGLALDLQAAWDAPGTTMRTKQRLVKALIEEILVDIDEEASQIVLTIHWKGGQHSQVRARKPRTGEHRRRAPEEALDIIRSMAGRWPEEQIAATLNRIGLQTGQENTWTARRVSSVRRTHGIRAYASAYKDGEWLTMSEAATQLGVSNHVIRRLIRSGILPAEQVVPRAPYQIRAADLDDEPVRRAMASRRRRRPCREELDNRTLRIPGT